MTRRFPLRFRTLIVGLFVAIVAMLFAPAAAIASPALRIDDDSAVQPVTSVCQSAEEHGANYLPVFRWTNATGEFHSRFSKTDLTGVMGRAVPQNVNMITFGLGNLLWKSSASFVEMATRACFIDAAGGIVDNTSGKLGKAVFDSGIGAALLFATILSVVWRGYRSGGINFNALGPKVLVIGLLAVMLTGAADSEGGGINGSGAKFEPGTGSPGWIATSIDGVVSTLAQAPLSVMYGTGSEELFDFKGASADARGRTDNGCALYVEALHESHTSENDTQVLKTSATTRAISSMWENSGLRSWRESQFGNKNSFGNHMYCYLLEANISVPVGGSVGEGEQAVEDTRKHMTNLVAEATGSTTGWTASKHPAVLKRDVDSDTVDRQMVALAQCRVKEGSSWKPNDDGTTVTAANFRVVKLSDADEKKVEAKDCEDAFRWKDAKLDKFDWPPNALRGVVGQAGEAVEGFVGFFGIGDGHDGIMAGSAAEQYANPGGPMNFVKSLQGSNMNDSGLMNGFVYLLSSLLVAASFGVLGIAIIGAKLTMLVLMGSFIFVAVATLLPNSDMSKVAKAGKQYVGVAFFVFGFQLIMALVAMVAKILTDFGDDSINNETLRMLWIGAAPALALWAIHHAFKKMGVPSPLSVNAGSAWGKAAAAGAVGGAASGAAGYMLGRRGLNRAMHTASQASQLAQNLGMNTGLLGKGALPNPPRPGEQTGLQSETDGELDDTTANEALDEFEGAGRVKKFTTARKARKDAARLGADGQPLSAGERARNKAKDAFAKFKAAPVKSVAKAALVGGAGMAMVAGASILAPAAALAAMGYAAKKGASAAATKAGMNTKANREAVAKATERRAQAAAAAEQREFEALAEQERLGRAYESGDDPDEVARQEEEMWEDYFSERDDPASTLDDYTKRKKLT